MSYGPPVWRPITLLAAALLAAGFALLVSVLWAPAAVLLAAALRDGLARPALVLTPAGFQYVAGLRRSFVSWDLVEAIRVREERHFLAFGRNLEIDLQDETLVVLSNLQLGAPADEVAAAVELAWQASARREGRSP